MFFEILCSKHDDRDMRSGGIGFELLCKLQTIHHRHHNIADYQVGHLLLSHFQSFFTVGSLQDKEVVLQQCALILSYVVVVVDNQYRRFISLLAHHLLHLALVLIAIVDILQYRLVRE